jgi:hypothetical protein
MQQDTLGGWGDESLIHHHSSIPYHPLLRFELRREVDVVDSRHTFEHALAAIRQKENEYFSTGQTLRL